MKLPKNPQTPPHRLVVEAADILIGSPNLWRVHTVVGAHALRWDELRHFGPARTMRWDPHPAPSGVHPTHGVSYAATGPETAFAEVFQSNRAIVVGPDRALVGWTPARDLQLLNMRGDWALRNGASASLFAAPKLTTRAWAAAIHEQHPYLDGLFVPSTMTGKDMVVLFTPAADSFPRFPSFSRLLDDPAARSIIDWSASELRWAVST